MTPTRYTPRTSWPLGPANPLLDSRRALRRAVALDVEFFFSNRQGPFICEARDMSPFGMWLDANEVLEPGANVLISFQPPNWPTFLDFTMLARIARVSRGRRQSDGGACGMAVEFTDLSAVEVDQMAECLAGMPPRRRRREAS